MRPTQIASLKNYKNSKFSYPKVNRNKSQTKPNFENNSFEKIEKNNPDVICEHRKKYYSIKFYLKFTKNKNIFQSLEYFLYKSKNLIIL